jgi:hypothetical protein
VDARQLRIHVVRPVLQSVSLWSPAAEELVLGTAAQESDGFRYIKQLGGGPALGLWQIEPATSRDIWDHWLAHRPGLAELVAGYIAPGHGREDQLVWNLALGAAMCRVFYRRFSAPLPAADDVEGQAAYWKRLYNTHLGKGRPEEYVEHYQRYVAGSA